MANDNNRKLFFDESNKELGFNDYNEFENILGVKKKGGTTQGSEELAQPSTTSGGVDQASIDKQKTLLYNIKKEYDTFLKEEDQALNDGWPVDYTTKHFSDKQQRLGSMLDELDNMGGDDVRRWTSGMRSALENSKNNVVAQRNSTFSWFSDPENLYAEDKGNREWFSKNVKEIESLYSGRQVNAPKEGLPSIKAPKKQEFGRGVPALRDIVQKPQEEMFKPEKDDYVSQKLKLAAYQEAQDQYKDLEDFTTNVNVNTDAAGNTSIDGVVVDYNKLIQNEALWKKYVGEDLPWPGGVYEPNPQKRANTRKEAEKRIKDKMQGLSEQVEQTLDTKIVDKIIEDNFNEKTYAHFITQPDEYITQTTIDAGKINDQVKQIVEHYGLDPKGSAARMLYDKAAAAVQFQSNNYDIEENFKEEHPEEYALREKYKSGKFQEEINARYISDLEAMFSEYQSQANAEVDTIISAAKKQADQISSEYSTRVEAIKEEAERLGEDFQNGIIDEMTYNDAVGKLNEQLSVLSDDFKSLLPDPGEILAETNKIYSRYNSNFENRKASIIKMADEELRKAAAGIPEEDLKKINTAYQAAMDKAFSDKNNELFNQLKMTQQESIIPLYMARRGFMNGLGSYIKNVGSYIDNQDMKVIGETMQNEWSSAAPKVSDIGFNADDLYYNSLNVLGNMGGNMSPAMLTAIGMSYLSGGAATGEALAFMAGWVGNWASETMSIAGQNGSAVLARTGDVRRSEKAVARTIQSQQDIFLSYALDGLPLTTAGYRLVSGFGKGLGADISGRIARAGVGAGVEVAVETFAQEIPQNIAEENIVKFERDPWTDFGEMYSQERIKETLVGVAPIGVLGAIGGARTGSLAQQRVDQANAFNDKAILAGGFEDQRRQYLQSLVFDKNEKYARAVVSSMFASGSIGQNEAAEMQEQITDAGRIKSSADQAKLNTAQRNVYGFFSARADEARRNADKHADDPILEKMYRQQQSQYERTGAEYLQGKAPDMLTLTYADGTTMMMTPEDAKGLSTNSDFLDLLAKRRVSVSGYGKTQPLLDEIQQSVNNHKTANVWKARAEAVTGLAKSVFAPAKVDIEDRKAEPTKQVEQDYNNTADLLAAMKTGDQFLSTVVSNPLWGKLSDDKRNSIRSISEQIKRDRQLLTDNDSESNEYKQAKERIAANERAVYEILSGKTNDQENITGVPGQVGVGQEPVKTQPIEGAGTEATQAGGVLQTQEEIEAKRADIEQRRQQELKDKEDILDIALGVNDDTRTVEQQINDRYDAELAALQAAPQAQEKVVSEDPRERVLEAITEQDYIDNAPAITTPDIERIKSQDSAKQQAIEKARKEAQSAFEYLDGKKTAKEFLTDNGYDVDGMSDEDAKKFADSDVEYWKGKLSAEEAKGGKKPSKGKQKGKTRTPQATVAQKEQEMMDLLEKGVQESQERIKQLIAGGATPDQAYAITEQEWKQTEDGKKYTALQEEANKAAQEKPATPERKKKKAEAPKMPEVPTEGQQRIATINALEKMIYDDAVGTAPMSLEQSSETKAKLAEMKKENKQGGLNEAETLMKKALGEKVVTMTDVDKMVKEKRVEVKCPPGTKKAEKGMRMGFIPGGKWDVVKEFKGKSHADGGIDIEIAGGKINYTGKDPNFKAKNGAFWNTLRDVGYTGIDAALGTVGSVAGIKSMQDIIDEDQYRNDKFDDASNFAGKIVGNALKVIPVTAPIASAVGAVGGIVNQVGQIDAKNYDESKHTSTLDKVGGILDVAGSVAGMAVTAGVANNAAKTFEAGDKLSAAHKMSMKLAPVNRNLGNAAKAMGVGQQPMQQAPAQQNMYQHGLSANGQQMVTINGVNYVPDQYGNLTPIT
jgi:hypothetical protein